ncbi:biosynthetic arginine decarboxylase [Litorivicinus lipolyticus]|uniref:biosynthetic arginine decarboxylase n=1 Tax=Litorivicinus lipolyticus TaxID=418701 RepID=UPI001FE44AFE|nr:biosynthetic arginine decarboxylase [Litorivicinus lipolyticus]
MTKKSWSSQDSSTLYSVPDWGKGVFSVNANGLLEVAPPNVPGAPKVPLMSILAGIKDRGMDLPVVLRIENLIDLQVSHLNQSFAAAIEAHDYQNVYRGVFPIKVNQQSQVIEEIARFGARYNHGLEAGSKAELMIAMATLTDPGSMIICNGYKDAEFVDLGLRARQLGFECFFVVETPAELDLILERAELLQVEPRIGFRAKLSTQVEGHWSEDSGDRSLFGLSANQIVNMVDRLRDTGHLEWLRLLHFHLGSQIPNIRDIRTGVAEAVRYYNELVAEGAAMGYLDLGGGLAVNYEGGDTNYTLAEYCYDVVESVAATLAEGVPHPVLISESGRATVADSSILLFNTLDVTTFEPGPIRTVTEDDAEAIQKLGEIQANVEVANAHQSFTDAIYYRDDMRESFQLGTTTLRQRALAENLCLDVMQQVKHLLPQMRRIPKELEALHQDLADIYYANFSVFQSLPDTWAMDQVFPVVPIHRLNEEPTREAILADLTCDCDGKIDLFVGGHSTLPVHSLVDGEDYVFGVFMVGAYQETLGDLHNLFGDTNVVSVRINEGGNFEIERELQGDTVEDVLSYVEYTPAGLTETFRKTAERAVRSGLIKPSQRREIVEQFRESLRGYTYYEH